MTVLTPVPGIWCTEISILDFQNPFSDSSVFLHLFKQEEEITTITHYFSKRKNKQQNQTNDQKKHFQKLSWQNMFSRTPQSNKSETPAPNGLTDSRI